MTQPSEENPDRLPGEITTNAEGKTEQEGYGEWPSCPNCNEQVEPALFSQHINSHDAAAAL